MTDNTLDPSVSGSEAMRADDIVAEVATALGIVQALHVVAEVAALPIGGKDADMPTTFHAGFQMACDEIAERLRPTPNTGIPSPMRLLLRMGVGMADELICAPCLFCRKPAYPHSRGFGASTVTCSSCGAGGPAAESLEKAVAMWNDGVARLAAANAKKGEG